MRLNAVRDVEKPRYPTFQDYWARPQHHLGTVTLVAGLVLGSALATGCAPKVGGTAPSESEMPDRLPGRVIEPHRPKLTGEPAPEPPPPTPPPTPPSVPDAT